FSELPIEITKPLKDTEVPEKQSLVLSCEVNKEDVPSKWQKNGTDLVESETVHLTVKGCVHTLTIDNASLEDEAVYKCLIKDRKTSARVSVKEAPVEIEKQLANIQVTEGQEIYLECQVSKPCDATWYKDGNKVQAEGRFKIKSDGTLHSLTLDEAELEDQAEYSVKVGDQVSKAKVLVEGQ
ncbi:hypothetical protein LOTGIDRAFT_85536, partial [Lottia gigantea]